MEDQGRPFNGPADADNQYYFWADGTVRDKPRGDASANVIGQDGKYETDLYSWVTEGTGGGKEGHALTTPPSPWHVGVPIGFGMRYMVTRQISVGWSSATTCSSPTCWTR